MYIDGGRGHEAMLVHHADTLVFGDAPHAGVGSYRQVEVTRNLEGGLLGEGRVAGHVESNLHAQHIAAPVDAAPDEVGELGGLCPLPGSAEQVAVGEDEPAWDRFERIHRCIGVINCLQAMRPVNRGGNSGVYGLNRRQEVAGINIFGTANLAPVEVVELEVVGEGPVSAEPTERCLPHMTVRVNHTWHENTPAGVDLQRAIRRSELPPDFSNAVVNDQDITALDHAKRGVNGQHGGVTKYHRAS